MQVKHRFISNVPDDPAADAAGQVLPSHWNQDHEFVVEPFSLVGNDGGSSAPAKAIAVNNGLRLFAGALSLLGVPVFFQPTEPDETGPFVWLSPDPQTGLSLSAKDEMGQLLQLAAGGGGGGANGAPTFVDPDEVFTVGRKSQLLFSSPIDCEGLLVVDGLLIEVI